MELIEKQAAMNCCFKPQVRPNEEIFNALKMAIRNEISALPSIDTVPMDKLCALLAKNADCPPAHSPFKITAKKIVRNVGSQYCKNGWRKKMRLINADELRDIYSSVPNGVYTTSHFITAIDECETVDAVPLNKLCDMLSQSEMFIPCKLCEYEVNGHQKCTKGTKCPYKADDWKRALTKWMEGLDGSENMVQKT